MPLDPKLKTLWLKGLRAQTKKKFRKTTYLLTTIDKRGKQCHCAIGVLAHIAKIPFTLRTINLNRAYKVREYTVTDYTTCASGSAIGVILDIDPKYTDQITILNDSKNASFAEIADYIEKTDL